LWTCDSHQSCRPEKEEAQDAAATKRVGAAEKKGQSCESEEFNARPESNPIKERLDVARMLLLAMTLAAASLFNLPEGVAAQAPSKEEPGTVLMQIAQSLGFFIGDHLTSRSESFGGCSLGGRDYPDGAWVPVGGSRICRCMRGIVRAPCKAERRQVQRPPPSSFAVGLSFGTSSMGNKNKNWTIGQIKKGIAEVSFKPPIVRLKTEGTKIAPQEKTVTRRRLTSGKGTAKLFKLFQEVQEPVVRTSNKTGCHVGGNFYEYPTLTQSMSACRCTVEGMLWCWRRGIPQCLGCMVGPSFVPAEGSFRLADGTGCSCQCKAKMEARCLRDNVLLHNAVVR